MSPSKEVWKGHPSSEASGVPGHRLISLHKNVPWPGTVGVTRDGDYGSLGRVDNRSSVNREVGCQQSSGQPRQHIPVSESVTTSPWCPGDDIHYSEANSLRPGIYVAQV